jgi:hypothetical protein
MPSLLDLIKNSSLTFLPSTYYLILPYYLLRLWLSVLYFNGITLPAFGANDGGTEPRNRGAVEVSFW